MTKTTARQATSLARHLLPLLALFVCSGLAAEPEQSYDISWEGKTYTYKMKRASHRDYFFEIPGNIYRYQAHGLRLPDTEETRRLILHRLGDAYISKLARLEPDKAVKLNKRGLCIPSILKTSGEEGAAFAINFQTPKKIIKGFVVGDSINCSLVDKY